MVNRYVPGAPAATNGVCELQLGGVGLHVVRGRGAGEGPGDQLADLDRRRGRLPVIVVVVGGGAVDGLDRRVGERGGRGDEDGGGRHGQRSRRFITPPPSAASSPCRRARASGSGRRTCRRRGRTRPARDTVSLGRTPTVSFQPSRSAASTGALERSSTRNWKPCRCIGCTRLEWFTNVQISVLPRRGRASIAVRVEAQAVDLPRGGAEREVPAPAGVGRGQRLGLAHPRRDLEVLAGAAAFDVEAHDRRPCRPGRPRWRARAPRRDRRPRSRARGRCARRDGEVPARVIRVSRAGRHRRRSGASGGPCRAAARRSARWTH